MVSKIEINFLSPSSTKQTLLNHLSKLRFNFLKTKGQDASDILNKLSVSNSGLF